MHCLEIRKKRFSRNRLFSGSVSSRQFRFRRMCSSDNLTSVQCFGVRNDAKFEDDPNLERTSSNYLVSAKVLKLRRPLTIRVKFNRQRWSQYHGAVTQALATYSLQGVWLWKNPNVDLGRCKVTWWDSLEAYYFNDGKSYSEDYSYFNSDDGLLCHGSAC